ncbi:MAG TPA: hypothetical protein VNC78_08065 [Actinomycetota bacterium]|nr:hypothetical protein [Actinomycetota bacterium]
MNEPFHRDGIWWLKGPGGTWYRWDLAEQVWTRSASEPPPAPLPPSVPDHLRISEGDATEPLAAGPAVSPAHAGTGTWDDDDVGDYQETSRFPSVMGPESRGNLWMWTVGGLVGLVVLVFLASALFGNGDDPGNGDPDEALTRAEMKAAFIADADVLCAEAREFQQNLPPPTNERELIRFAQRVKEINRTLHSGLSGLEPPRRDEKKVEKMIGALSKSLRFLDEAIAAAKNDEEAAFARADGTATRFATQFRKKADRYGIKECGIENN